MSATQSGVKPILPASDRLQNVPEYALARVFQVRDEKLRQGVDVIDLGVGNPDLRPPRIAVETLHAALDDPAVQNHRYPSFDGLPELRAAAAAWYASRFAVTIDAATEVQPLIGSKEGIAKFMFAHLNPGDTILQCTPCYPAYLGIAALVQARLVEVPMVASRHFLPDLTAIDGDDARRAKVICVNFPSNPTGAVETAEFYRDLLQFARDFDLFVVSDIAYCDLSLDPGYRTRSFLEFDRDRERTIEFHSFSKSYSMQGWRIGLATGNAEAIARLRRIKANMDFGVFMAVQRAAAATLAGAGDYCAEVSRVYRERRDAFIAALAPLGYPIAAPRATIYVWMPVARAHSSSVAFTAELLDRTGVLVAPGSAFGEAGEGFVRVALCDDVARLAEAGRRIAEAGLTY